MPKPILYLNFIVLCIFLSCQSSPGPQNSNNKEIIIENEKMLLGEIDRKDLQDSAYAEWFNVNYQSYDPKLETINSLVSFMDEVKIKVFMGTWCSDSQREVPVLFRILDEMKYDAGDLQMVAVDRSKKLPEVDVAGQGIEYVPTLIFYRNQKEIGRIIETPNLTLEEDVLEIIVENRE